MNSYQRLVSNFEIDRNSIWISYSTFNRVHSSTILEHESKQIINEETIDSRASQFLY